MERSRADAVGHGFREHVHPVGPSVEVHIRANGVAKTRQRLKGEDLRHRIHRGGQQREESRVGTDVEHDTRAPSEFEERPDRLRLVTFEPTPVETAPNRIVRSGSIE